MRANFSFLPNEESEFIHLMRGGGEEVPYARSQQACTASEKKRENQGMESNSSSSVKCLNIIIFHDHL